MRVIIRCFLLVINNLRGRFALDKKNGAPSSVREIVTSIFSDIRQMQVRNVDFPYRRTDAVHQIFGHAECSLQTVSTAAAREIQVKDDPEVKYAGH